MADNDLILAMLAAAEANLTAAGRAIGAARALYESGVLEPEPPADPAAPCIHPPPLRLQCGTLADPDAFMCKGCGHIEQKEPTDGR
jgi:hypothetical protein